MLKIKKIKKITKKEKVEVLAQFTDCSTQAHPFGPDRGCDNDCKADKTHYRYYGSPLY